MSSLIKGVKKEASFFKRLVILVGFKEAYFFLKNFLGMIIHPHLTTAKIFAKKDLSQAFLVFGLPFNLWFLLIFFSFLIWFWLRPTGYILAFGLVFFLLIGFFLLILALYYLYWAIKYWRFRQ